MTLSSVYPSHCAQDKHLIHFLLFVQLHNFPPEQVKSLVAQFGPTLQAHLSIVFEDLQVYSQTSDCDLKVQSGLLRQQKASGTTQHYSDLFQVLLQSQEEASPCRYLLQEAVIQRCPMLAILAACLQRSELLPCLCVWVLTSIDDVTAREATSHLPEAPQDHQWSLHDLSIIWKTLLGRGLVRPLLRGFEFFQRECPLVLVLRMFELCCDYRNFTDAKSKLLDFQRVLITVNHVLPLQWVESQASVLLLTMLHRCSSQYDLHRLLQLLADVDKLLKSNGRCNVLLQSSSLKTALLDYIKRWLPADSEKHNMVALCFSMRREIGENHEMAAKTQLKMIESQPWGELGHSLVKVLSLLKDAAESFSKDSCVRQASRCVCTAKLITLQLHFLNQGSELRIINLRPTEVLNALLALPRCYQVMVVSEAYSYSPDWAEILYQKVILNGDFTFLEEFKHQRPLTSTLFEDIFEKINGGSSTITPNVKRLLTHCEDVYSRYRLAYQHNFYDVTKMLLQDSKTCNYLNDKLAS
uniref:Spatacsin C-terminal domain-containing protein n=1 Tax=Gouania willdenowi TaxID=441366 RepID=A0A8C5HR24_GOUWI